MCKFVIFLRKFRPDYGIVEKMPFHRLRKGKKDMQALEFTILDWIQTNLRCGFLDTVMPAVSRLGNAGLIWIVLTLILLAVPKTRRTGRTLAIALLLDLVCCNLILKPLVARIRPCDVRAAVSLLIAHPRDYSFPSGHAAASFTAVSALFFSGNRLWKPSLVLAVLISFSRLYLYVHWPSDVVAGAFLGIALGFLARRLDLTIRDAGRRGPRQTEG